MCHNNFCACDKLVKLEGKIYKTLLSEGACEAKELAGRVGIVTQGVYRPLRKLIKLSLVVPVGKHPARFQALPIETGLEKVINDIYQILGKYGEDREDIKAEFRRLCELYSTNHQ